MMAEEWHSADISVRLRRAAAAALAGAAILGAATACSSSGSPAASADLGHAGQHGIGQRSGRPAGRAERG